MLFFFPIHFHLLATITFATVIGYPFKLALVNASGVGVSGNSNPNCGLSSGFTTLVSANAGTPTFATVSGTQSTQPWNLDILPPPNCCYYSGTYSLNAVFNIVCALTPTSLCPAITDNTVAVTLDITSENFCPAVAVAVSVIAELTSYSDAAFTVPFAYAFLSFFFLLFSSLFFSFRIFLFFNS
jgi:hypothetical protein